MRYLVKAALRFRAAPTTKSAILGVMPAGIEVATVTDQQVDADGCRWVNIRWNGQTGWAALQTLPDVYIRLANS